MIKRIIGIVATLAIIALVVFTILGRDKYTSVLFTEPPVEAAAEVDTAPVKAVAPADSIPAHVVDSLQVSAPDEVLP